MSSQELLKSAGAYPLRIGRVVQHMFADEALGLDEVDTKGLGDLSYGDPRHRRNIRREPKLED